MSDAPVLFDTIPAGHYRIGVATLNNSRRLNALDNAMISLLQPQLDEWAQDPAIAMVVLQGAGDRAFCSGGDIRDMATAIKSGDLTRAERYFSEEYRLDYALHTYPKPILAWCHGVTMGGGLGLMQGASHRVVTDDALLAMPEIGIGLFPDVGAAWFLQRMPGRLGLFCGLTGARLGADDAVSCGLADYRIAADRHGTVLGRLPTLAFSDDPAANHEALSVFLRAQHRAGAQSGMLQRLERINAITDHRDPVPIRDALAAAAEDDNWFAPCNTRVTDGSPTTFALVLEQFTRCRRMSLREVLQMDLVIAMRCCKHSDFPEGVRALLLDKDGDPHWTPARLEDVDRTELAEYFIRPWPAGAGPLDDLGRH
ncbi:enoyl-CoA hydratase/carnithine racemase [Natronocella acetinitrilica]|uniref:3-hydroxyisobutyryl-CoA hydrolase n=1 Tax=Natronocella acetinitrilica TaxID=414046 RepID=A0AAE3G6A7_9GAMM|nr:enoyl-CoA hydratase/isomerase family protein [Natronocella acetinitrilica]MCP1676187.1 enoyl-CoA hydratase/carnithine racemase [Natronocella acetinitrilica]